MSKPVLIVVTGYPGSGKTSLAEGLARSLCVPLFTKDDVKESLFDTMGVGDRAWSHRLGRASMEILYNEAERCLSVGHLVVVEANFDHDLSVPDLIDVIEATGSDVVQIVVTADPGELAKRYQRRPDDETRHPGHLDGALIDELTELVKTPYRPLDLPGPVITVDTTPPNQADAESIAAQVSRLL